MLKRVIVFFFLFCCLIAHSCTKGNLIDPVIVDTSFVEDRTGKETPQKSIIKVAQFGSLGLSHQSAASYGNYVIFVTSGRSAFSLYNLKTKTLLCTLKKAGANKMIYHCNQSFFGIEKYDSSDPFPLLYISQNARIDQRCFIEVFRILPKIDDGQDDYSSFSINLVQTIILPTMSKENSLGNVNCTIDVENKIMYTYSRNNDPKEDNYGKCKINLFPLPSFQEGTITLEDEDILSAYMIDCEAFYMQGGCIKNGILYIGQGSYSVGYIYLNIVDIKNKVLVRCIDLEDYHVAWEPEGCFFYGDRLMLSHSSAISEIVFN